MHWIDMRSAILVAALGSACLPALASSTATSSAADGISASIGSISGSLDVSSNSSTKAVAAGDYRIIEIAEAPDHPGMLRLTLQPANHGEEALAVLLFVPRQTLKQNPLKTGQLVSARDKPYGTEFAVTDSGKGFFLLLQDSWYRELQATVVTL